MERPDLYSGDDVEISGGGFHDLRGYVQHVRYSRNTGYMIEVMVKVSWSDDLVMMTFPPQWVRKL